MNASLPPSAQAQALPFAEGRIDWGAGRLIGFSVPSQDGSAFDVVQLLLDGHCVMSAVANRSVFELARDLAGLPLPAKEHSGFELRIPQRSLLPGHFKAAPLPLEVRTAQGHVIFSHTVQGPHELLRLTEGAPADLMFGVQFKHVAEGAVHGVVVDTHGTGVRPQLLVRFNDGPTDPLAIFQSSADGRVHHFSVPLRADRLSAGINHLHVQTPTGQPMASYPIQVGGVVLGETDRRLGALEAEVAFLKHLLLNQNSDALNARLALMKGEIINICSDMLTLQRTNLEREVLGQVRPGASSEPASGKPAR